MKVKRFLTRHRLRSWGLLQWGVLKGTLHVWSYSEVGACQWVEPFEESYLEFSRAAYFMTGGKWTYRLISTWFRR